MLTMKLLLLHQVRVFWSLRERCYGNQFSDDDDDAHICRARP